MNQLKSPVKMYVVKRNGNKQPVEFDKITARIEAQCALEPPLDTEFVDAVEVAQKVIAGLFPVRFPRSSGCFLHLSRRFADSFGVFERFFRIVFDCFGAKRRFPFFGIASLMNLALSR